MSNQQDRSKEEFLNPISKFQGKVTPENIIFNANLQEFANQVAIVCGLETNGKLSAEEAYEKIKALWQQLKESKNNLLDRKQD